MAAVTTRDAGGRGESLSERGAVERSRGEVEGGRAGRVGGREGGRAAGGMDGLRMGRECEGGEGGEDRRRPVRTHPAVSSGCSTRCPLRAQLCVNGMVPPVMVGMVALVSQWCAAVCQMVPTVRMLAAPPPSNGQWSVDCVTIPLYMRQGDVRAARRIGGGARATWPCRAGRQLRLAWLTLVRVVLNQRRADRRLERRTVRHWQRCWVTWVAISAQVKRRTHERG